MPKPNDSPLKPVRPDMPWLTDPAIKRLSSIVKKGMRILEYGSGGSTVWFVRRGCRVVSVEHKKEWWVKTSGMLLKNGYHDSMCLYYPPEKEGPSQYQGADHKFHTRYAYHGAEVAQAFLRRIDLVFVDGRGRVGCVYQSVGRSPAPIIVLDDSQRPYYGPAATVLKKHRYKLEKIKLGKYETDFWFPHGR